MRNSAAEKLQRLISIVSWINAEDGPTVAEVCARFDIGRSDLISQLNMASMIGDGAGDYVDMPIEVFYEDDRVHIHLTAFQRPLRLTPEQAFALLTAGAGVLRLQSAAEAGPLSRAVRKVAAVLGIDPGETIDVDLGEADTEVLDLLRESSRLHRPVEIVYWSAGRDHHTQRVVDPWRVFNEQGAWYLRGWCRLAEDERVFRVDRMRSVSQRKGTFKPPKAVVDAPAYRAGADDPRVVLDLEPEARWVAAVYPIDQAEEQPNGRLRITMPAGAPAFLARLLLRLGPNAVVVDTDDRSGATAIAHEAAQRILTRYGPSASE